MGRPLIASPEGTVANRSPEAMSVISQGVLALAKRLPSPTKPQRATESFSLFFIIAVKAQVTSPKWAGHAVLWP